MMIRLPSRLISPIKPLSKKPLSKRLFSTVLYSGVIVLLCSIVACTAMQQAVQDINPLSLPNLDTTEHRITLQQGIDISLGHEPTAIEAQLRPMLLDNTYYVANNKGNVYALDSQGKAKWAVTLETQISAGVVASHQAVVVATRQGDIVALSPKTGQLLWRYAIGVGVSEPSVIAGNVVVNVASDGSVTALDVTSGKLVWVFDLPINKRNSLNRYAPPILYDGDTILVSCSGNGRIYALDLYTGNPKWNALVTSNNSDTVTDKPQFVAAPLLDGHQLFTISYNGQISASNLDMMRTTWQKPASSLQGLAAGLGNVYVVDTADVLTAYDEITGAVVWQQKSLTQRQLSDPVVLGRYLLVGDRSGTVHVIEQVAGKLVGRIRVNGVVRHLLVINDKLLVQTENGHFSTWQLVD